jgi:hypothetical protein
MPFLSLLRGALKRDSACCKIFDGATCAELSDRNERM